MNIKRKKCQVDGCENPVWSKGVCQNHAPKTPLKKTTKIKTGGRRSGKSHVLMKELFMHIWRKRRHVSEVSRKSLGKEPLTIYFHHILPKSKYPQAAFDPENIILLTWEEHENVEMDMYKYEEVNKRRETLLRKYDLI
jgi:hypothetical protein